MTETSAVRWARAAAAGDPAAIARQEIAGLRTCCNCGRQGYEGKDVLTAWHWLGGKGDVLVTYCRDIVSCWERRDQKEADGKK